MIPLLIYGFAVGILYAWVLTYLWQWFVVTTFSIKALTIAQAYGLIMIFGFLRHGALTRADLLPLISKEKKTTSYYVGLFINPIISALITLGIGYFVYSQFIR